MRWFLFVVVWMALKAWPLNALDPAKPLTNFQRQNWQTESGLPQNTVPRHSTNTRWLFVAGNRRWLGAL